MLCEPLIALLAACEVSSHGGSRAERIARVTGWGQALILIQRGAHVLEVHSPLPAGEPSTRSKFFNLGEAPFTGHLRPDLLSAIHLVAIPGREGLVSVWVEDASGQPLGGVELMVMGSQEGSSFFTGLKPETGIGFADLWLGPEDAYAIGPAASGSDLAIDLGRAVPPGLCPTTTLGLEWRLTFQQQ